MWMTLTIASVWGKEVRRTSLAEKIMRVWDHFVWEMGPSAWLASVLESRGVV
jgi:hypothetical protein